MEQECNIKPETNKQCEEPTKLYYKEGRKIICLDDDEAENITSPIYKLLDYVDREASVERGEVSRNNEKCKECFVVDMPSTKVKQIFYDHRRIDWFNLNDIWVLNAFALVHGTLKHDEYGDLEAFYLVHEEEDGYKIHTFSLEAIMLQRLKHLADPDDKPFDLDAFFDAMAYLVQS